MRRRRAPLALAGWMTWGLWAVAASAQPLPLTLSDATARALERLPEIAIQRDAMIGGGGQSRMIGGKIEGRRHLTLQLAFAHQRAVATPAERQRESVKQNGFARAGFARQHGQPGARLQVQPVDQHNVANGELNEHRLRDPRGRDGVSRLAAAEKLRHPRIRMFLRLRAGAL